ncbi:uncharacterized protein LOC108485307 [Gossypium arboreum]|uniref:uncharacterized protein LOC108485307 n=1 Tax=Gossypium arboreum TaxID=29729 RepID=UPI00081918AE|nr:uncharacterized protein LOC108485307 [Gossypium arboreum]
MGRDRRALGSHTEVRQPALVHAARPQEDRDAPNVIMGTFLIFNVPYTALIDVGSTHSSIACTVTENLGILVKNTSSGSTVFCPLRQSVRVNKLFRDVSREVQWVIFLTDLMELPFREFHLILGMDWLVKHRVILDCATKRVVLRTEEDVEVVVIRERRTYLSIVISALRAEKLVRKGGEAYLSYISALEFKGLSVKDIRTTKDFLDVFPDELPGLPLNREVEFGIELLPVVFIDDILEYSKTEVEHDEHLRGVLQILREAIVRQVQ